MKNKKGISGEMYVSLRTGGGSGGSGGGSGSGDGTEVGGGGKH